MISLMRRAARSVSSMSLMAVPSLVKDLPER
jgi:hypothetical protein